METLKFERKTLEGERQYIKVIDTFKHHFTKEKMRQIRIETVGIVFGRGYAEIKIVNEKDFERLLETRID